MHTDAEQTATLHAIPAFAEFARARGIRRWDWVLLDGEEFVYGGRDPDDSDEYFWEADTGHSIGNIDPADCLLMPSEIDLMDFLEHRDGMVEVRGPIDDEEGIAEAFYEVETSAMMGCSDTRIGALVAAAEAAERSDEG